MGKIITGLTLMFRTIQEQSEIPGAGGGGCVPMG